MSSKKRKTKQPSRSPLPTTSTSPEKTSPPGEDDVGEIVVKTEPLDTVEVKEEPVDDDTTHSSMLLDVLAQVASDRLQSPSVRKPPTVTKKTRLTKRGAQSMHHLTLDQIDTLSEKSLINLFAEYDSNELTRNFTYGCRLLPEVCSASFSSFGNESKAKSRLKDHLLTHLNELRRDDPTFKAETIQARQRRIIAEIGLVKTKCGSKTDNSAKSPSRKSHGKSRGDSSSAPYSSIKSMGSSAVVEKHPTLASTLHFSSPPRPDSKKSVNRSKLAARKLLRQSVKRKAIVDMSKDAEVATDGEHTRRDAADDNNDRRKDAADVESEHMEKERLIIDLLGRIQPFQDHPYTSVFGKQWHRNASAKFASVGDNVTMLEDASARTSAFRYIRCEADPRELRPSNEASKPIVLKVNASDVACANSIHIPIIRLARSSIPTTGTMPPQEKISGLTYEDVTVDGPGGMETLQGSLIRKRRRKADELTDLFDRELDDEDTEEVEEELDPEEQQKGEETSISLTSTNRNVICNLPKNLERKLAMKYIRELRYKRRDHSSLVCKICKTKSFTATATLMYHYRSHAGIKPFVCLICTETFTRQHSLNYHMLIHNNQSRFTCKDCGRKFRHPSHFKEHLRRHTGETPFSCTDCPLRFKTRNTYKRHLKTRHGKLLTANGIRLLPYDEFLKIRTKPSLFLNEDGQRDNDDEEFEDDEDDDGMSQEGELDVELVTSVNKEPEGTTVAEDEPEGAGRNETPASNKLLQFCSQVVSQVS